MTVQERSRSLGNSQAENGIGTQGWKQLMEWTVILYTISTIIEGALFSLGSTRVAKFTAPILIAAVLAYALLNRIPRFFNLALAGLVGVFTIVGLTGLTSTYPELAQIRTQTFGMLVIASTALTAALAVLGRRGIVCVQRGLVAGAAMASFLIVTARSRGDFIGVTEYERLEARASAGQADPNDIALALAITLPACLWSKHWLPRYVVAPLVVAAIFFTGSRGGIAALAAGGLAAVVVLARASAHPIRQTATAAGLALVGLLATWALLPEALVDRFKTLPQEVSSGTMTRRTRYWQAAWAQFGESPFWGTGAGSAPDLNYRISGRNQVFHNTYLSYLVELGILGFLFFLLALSAAWLGAVLASREVGWMVVSITIMTVGIVALSWDARKLMWLILITGAALLWRQNSTDTSQPESAITKPPNIRKVDNGRRHRIS